MSPAAHRLIVALDYPAAEPALELVDRLGDAVLWYKIGLELYSAEGPDVVARVRDRGKRIFLDTKFHDIPNTVAGAARAVSTLGVDLFNIHAAGGSEMMRAAKEAATEGAEAAGVPPPAVYAVTILTSLNDKAVRSELGIADGVAGGVRRFALLAQEAGLDGVVASPTDLRPLRDCCGAHFGIVTPGIRPAGTEIHDQRRTATPALAIQHGATYIVMGRTITRAQDPIAVVHSILAEMELVL